MNEVEYLQVSIKETQSQLKISRGCSMFSNISITQGSHKSLSSLSPSEITPLPALAFAFAFAWMPQLVCYTPAFGNTLLLYRSYVCKCLFALHDILGLFAVSTARKFTMQRGFRAFTFSAIRESSSLLTNADRSLELVLPMLPEWTPLYVPYGVRAYPFLLGTWHCKWLLPL